MLMGLWLPGCALVIFVRHFRGRAVARTRISAQPISGSGCHAKRRSAELRVTNQKPPFWPSAACRIFVGLLGLVEAPALVKSCRLSMAALDREARANRLNDVGEGP